MQHKKKVRNKNRVQLPTVLKMGVDLNISKWKPIFLMIVVWWKQVANVCKTVVDNTNIYVCWTPNIYYVSLPFGTYMAIFQLYITVFLQPKTNNMLDANSSALCNCFCIKSALCVQRFHKLFTQLTRRHSLRSINF